jgi:hypothetical protein
MGIGAVGITDGGAGTGGTIGGTAVPVCHTHADGAQQTDASHASRVSYDAHAAAHVSRRARRKKSIFFLLFSLLSFGFCDGLS